MQYRHLSLEPDNEILLSLIDFGSSARLYSICATLSPRLEIDGSGSGDMYLNVKGNVLSGEDITCALKKKLSWLVFPCTLDSCYGISFSLHN